MMWWHSKAQAADALTRVAPLLQFGVDPKLTPRPGPGRLQAHEADVVAKFWHSLLPDFPTPPTTGRIPSGGTERQSTGHAGERLSRCALWWRSERATGILNAIAKPFARPLEEAPADQDGETGKDSGAISAKQTLKQAR